MKFSIQVVKENIRVDLSSDPKPFYVKEEEVKKKKQKNRPQQNPKATSIAKLCH